MWEQEGQLASFEARSTSSLTLKKRTGTGIALKNPNLFWREKMKVLVGADGSLINQKAIEFLARVPIPNLEVTFAHCIDKLNYDPACLSEESIVELKKYNDDMAAQGEKIIEDCVRKAEGLNLNGKGALFWGDPAEELCKTIADKSFDMVVVGARGLNPVKEILLGSVSDKVLRASAASVLVFRPNSGHFGDSFKVVVGYDQTDSSKSACKFIGAHLHNAKVHLQSYSKVNLFYSLHAVTQPLTVYPDKGLSLEQSLLNTKQSMEGMSDNLDITFDSVYGSFNVADDLDKHRCKEACDLVVVGSNQKKWLERAVLGSVSSRLAHQAHGPVLIVKTEGE